MKMREIIGWIAAAAIAVWALLTRPRPVITGGTVGPGPKADTKGTLSQEEIEQMQRELEEKR